ncbi:methyltransferase domain-containing protein [Coleofasciculus sp. FACHB-712]|uniref:methyltransferase domain-containing protein n=1 Tax=Coleofasciculus sp. FACHB-712 TaxID=2692789 RepID=UPI001683688C|nr:methyltransferase domain-containing protein [Coleofasciculus sp. FACHB-712]MBD1945814.1 methyltransferase domain-containing protein [Coleofasciculus sp. FACHB-712]
MPNLKLKAFLKSRPLFTSTAYVADDIICGFRLKAGQIKTLSGATHSTLYRDESVRYIEEVFTDYKKYGLLEKFYGIAAEIGPGDNAGVALLMRRDGCDRVDLIDRYFSYRDTEQQSKIYELIAQKYELYQFRKKDFWDERSLAGIYWKIGQPAEVYFQKCDQEQGQIYDFIVSRAVLEHLYNPLEALQHMVDCLKTGGRMFHKIDLRDHGMFTPTHHELTFLQIPLSIYRLMVQNSGRPNRILVHRYREVLEAMKKSGLIDYSLLVTRLVSVGNINPHQRFEEIEPNKRRQAMDFVEFHSHKFAKEFGNVKSQDLCISGIFLIVSKK